MVSSSIEYRANGLFVVNLVNPRIQGYQVMDPLDDVVPVL